MAKGAGAAFSKLQVPQDGLSQSIQFWGKQQGQSIDNITKRNERDQVREQDKRSKLAEGIDTAPIIGTMVGQPNLDKVTNTFAKNMQDNLVEFDLKARESLASGNYEDFNKYKGQMQRARSSMGNYNATIEKIEPQIQSYIERSSNDELNPNDNESLILDAIIKNNYIPDIDENQNLSLLIGVDRNEDGIVSDEEKAAGEAYLKDGVVADGYEFVRKSAQELADGSVRVFGKPNLTGEKGLIGELANGIGLSTFDGEVDANGKPTSKGSYIKSFEGFDEGKLGQLETMAKSKLQDPETLAWVLTQATGSKKASHDIDDYTEIEKEKALKFLVEGAVNTFDTKEGMKYNYAKDTSARGWAREKRLGAGDDSEESGGKATATLVTGVDGSPTKTIGARQEGKTRETIRLFSLSGSNKGILSSNPNTEVITFYKGTDGNYYANTRLSNRASEKISEGMGMDSSEKTVKQEEFKTGEVKLKDDDLVRLAKRLGVDAVTDLDSFLDKQEGGKSEAQKMIERVRNQK